MHDAKSKAGEIGKIGEYPPGAAEITLVAGKRSEDIVLQRFALLDILQRPFLSQSRTRGGTYALRSGAFKLTKRRELVAIRRTKPTNFLFFPSSALRELQAPNMKRGEKVSFVEPSRAFNMYISALSAAFGELQDLFRSLTYIGPLRERPRRYYPIAGEMPISVGSRGEHMANLVRSRLPQFRRQLDTWIRRFEFGSRLVVDDVSDELFFLSFESRTKPTKTNIADAGFGASQVLPLIVQALAAQSQSLTIAEQPEIHLNPRLQYPLADLFVEMANSDHRVIVETHSEHLLLRLRRLVASGKIEHSKVAIYFVEKRDGASSIRRIPLEDNGHIAANIWPKGFFEDSLRESLALAAAQWPRSAKGKRP